VLPLWHLQARIAAGEVQLCCCCRCASCGWCAISTARQLRSSKTSHAGATAALNLRDVSFRIYWDLDNIRPTSSSLATTVLAHRIKVHATHQLPTPWYVGCLLTVLPCRVLAGCSGGTRMRRGIILGLCQHQDLLRLGVCRTFVASRRPPCSPGTVACICSILMHQIGRPHLARCVSTCQSLKHL
jgi:hypothetical protein